VLLFGLKREVKERRACEIWFVSHWNVRRGNRGKSICDAPPL
jgi:hypothetical protein